MGGRTRGNTTPMSLNVDDPSAARDDSGAARDDSGVAADGRAARRLDAGPLPDATLLDAYSRADAIAAARQVAPRS